MAVMMPGVDIQYRRRKTHSRRSQEDNSHFHGHGNNDYPSSPHGSRNEPSMDEAALKARQRLEEKLGCFRPSRLNGVQANEGRANQTTTTTTRDSDDNQYLVSRILGRRPWHFQSSNSSASRVPRTARISPSRASPEISFNSTFDLPDFFDDQTLSKQKSVGHSSDFSRRSVDSVSGKTPRWEEFWSDAAVDRRRRRRKSNSSSESSWSSSESPERFFDIPRSEQPEWVKEYVGQIGEVLREGRWGESDVDEIVHVSVSGFFEGSEMVLLDNQAVFRSNRFEILRLRTRTYSLRLCCSHLNKLRV
ncbi:hypothetical protein Vadar_010337 [Vaccinium darrowii]|uniref:Uncharacterized protein n=1 Tax=Vaccinium darrowii TaxID=229202 RepID=A0ACB7XPR4_9ERIC|nr:hypothetical protein Vadar_010337 [Vaccinium darrowii]